MMMMNNRTMTIAKLARLSKVDHWLAEEQTSRFEAENHPAIFLHICLLTQLTSASVKCNYIHIRRPTSLRTGKPRRYTAERNRRRVRRTELRWIIYRALIQFLTRRKLRGHATGSAVRDRIAHARRSVTETCIHDERRANPWAPVRARERRGRSYCRRR